MGECSNCIQIRITLEGFIKGLFTKGWEGKGKPQEIMQLHRAGNARAVPCSLAQKGGTHDVIDSENPKAEVCVERTTLRGSNLQPLVVSTANLRQIQRSQENEHSDLSCLFLSHLPRLLLSQRQSDTPSQRTREPIEVCLLRQDREVWRPILEGAMEETGHITEIKVGHACIKSDQR